MPYEPSPSRLEAFSDGVIAVIITIMVLEFKVPHENGFPGLLSIAPTLGVYLLSFTFTGIYWVNHHHLVDRLKHIDPLILWANLAFLFCLSLLPFFTNYMVEKGLDSFSVSVYAALLFVTGLGFTLLQKSISRHLHDHDEAHGTREFALQLAEQRKGMVSLGMYLLAAILAQVRPWLGLLNAALVTVLWIVPTFGLEHQQPPEPE